MNAIHLRKSISNNRGANRFFETPALEVSGKKNSIKNYPVKKIFPPG
jgi:hypothetical protein